MRNGRSLIEVEHLSKTFAQERTLREIVRGAPVAQTSAVCDVTFAVEQSEVFGLVGPNGAGKTTLLRLLSTLLVPTSGTARINGADIRRDAASVRAQIGLVTSNERSFFWRLSGRQNLRFFADLYHLPTRAAERWIGELLEMLGLTENSDQRFDSYSTGTKQRMAIARGLLSRPRVLFMDEPTKGVDPGSSQSLIRLIRESVVSRWKQTVIITTHNLREIEQLCDRTMIMDHGHTAYLGTLSALKQRVSEDEVYHFIVLGFSPALIGELASIDGVAAPVACETVAQGLQLEARIRKHSRAFPDLLRFIIAHGGEVESCCRVEVPIEHAFVNFMETLRRPSVVEAEA